MRRGPHLLAIGLAALVACSVVNAPDDPQPANATDAAGGGTSEGCPDGYAFCGAACVKIANDPAHCGACDNACAAGEVCGGGQCLADCAGGTIDCGGSCVSLDTDAAHCGACQAACPAVNASATCTAGVCEFTCGPGFSDCDGDPANACEQDVLSDASNCGGCGETCVAFGNAAAACDGGACVLGPCNAGFEDCDGDPANGCEAQLDRDPTNCLGCGNACTGVTPNCVNGCTSATWLSGVQQNLSLTSLTTSGWQVCMVEGYDDSGRSVDDAVNISCPGSALMLACRMNGSNVLSVAAMGFREDVTTDCADGGAMCGGPADCTHTANGVGWYFDRNWSIGFAPAGAPVDRCSCDTASTQQNQRMCWHANGGELSLGYRCGADIVSGMHERMILQLP